MKVNLIVLFLSVLLVGCSQETSDSGFEHTVKIGEIRDSVDFSELYDSVKYIPLDAGEKLFVGEVEQLLVDDGRIFVRDQNGVFCFGMDGKMLYVLNRKGHARDEFTDVSTMSLSNGELSIFDCSSKKMMFFNAATGKFIKSVEIPFFAIRLYCIDNTLINDVYFMKTPDNPNGENYVVYDMAKDFHVKYCALTMDELLYPMNFENRLSGYGLLTKSFYGCKAWKVTPEALVPYIDVDIPEDKALSEEDKEKLKTEYYDSKSFELKGKIYGLDFLAETEQYITGRMFFHPDDFEEIYFIYDKNEKKTLCFNDITFDSFVWVPVCFMTADKDCFYRMIPTDFEHITKKVADFNGDTLDYRYKNPVVAKYYIKKKIKFDK